MNLEWTVGADDLLDFERAVLVAFQEKLEEPPDLPYVYNGEGFDDLRLPNYLYDKHDSLVLTIDAKGRAFLCNSRGHNTNERTTFRPNQRWYVRTTSLLDRISKELRAIRDGYGGRLFIDLSGIRTKEEAQNYIDVVKWRLPEGSVFLRSRKNRE